MRKAISLALILLLLAVSIPVQAAPEAFTLMIYLCGTDLETKGGAASEDLLEIFAANIPAGSPVTILVETGGTRAWWLDNVEAGKSERWVVEGQGMRCLSSGRRSDMGDAATLADFVAFGASAYPADRYGLILWNHGGGSTSGVCFDEYTGSFLTNADIHDALSAVERAIPSFHLNFMALDACLMATYELACYLAPHADYLIASEELVPGSGLSYTAPLRALAGDPGMDTLALCRLFVDHFMADTYALDPDDYFTLSVLDLSRMQALTRALEGMAYGLQDVLDSGNLRMLSRQRQTMRSLGAYSDMGSDMVDLRQLIALLGDIAGGDTDTLLAALEDVVVYNRYTEHNLDNIGGISILVPLQTKEDFAQYSAYYDPLGLFPAYSAFLADYAALLGGGSYTFAATQPQATSGLGMLASLGEDVTYSGWTPVRPQAEVSAPQAEADAPAGGWALLPDGAPQATAPPVGGWGLLDIIRQIDEAGPVGDEGAFDESGILTYSLALTGEDMDNLAYVEGNLMIDISDGEMEAYIDLGYLRHTLVDWDNAMVYSLFDGTWPMLEGQVVHMTDQIITRRTRRSLIDVTVNGEDVYLLVVFDEARPGGEIIGYTEGYNDSGLPMRGYHKLASGDVIVPQYYLYRYDGEGKESIERFEGEVILCTGGALSFGYETIVGEGLDFAYSFCLNDIFGDYSFSDFIFFSL